MTVVKKKAVAKKKAAPKKAAAKKKAARLGIKRTTTTEVTLDTTPKKKKPTAVTPKEIPQVTIPEDTFVPPKDVEKYEDGFIITIAIAALAATVALLIWMVSN